MAGMVFIISIPTEKQERSKNITIENTNAINTNNGKTADLVEIIEDANRLIENRKAIESNDKKVY